MVTHEYTQIELLYKPIDSKYPLPNLQGKLKWHSAAATAIVSKHTREGLQEQGASE
jgi:hypothetical protein